jgi:hypothetical protein
VAGRARRHEIVISVKYSSPDGAAPLKGARLPTFLAAEARIMVE